MVYCMFEQSGTFKNEFKKLGIDAIDLDILNEFGETDRVIDLFAEIEKGYQGKPSVFDEVKEDDLIMSFFPCTRFECKVPLLTRTEMWQARNWKTEERLEYSRRTFSEVNDMYQLWCKMFLTTIRGGQRMICENPYNQPHILTQHFPLKPDIIDKDRTRRGDFYEKPTQYWFVNCQPQENFFLENLQTDDKYIKVIERVHGEDRKTQRSMISPVYANRFIREFILEEKNK
jgi:hypothetical protein